MSGNRFVTPVFTPIDVNGAPVTNAELYFYENNSNTPKNSWSDVGLTVLNSWPVRASGTSGFLTDLFLDTSPYREVLKDQNGVVIWDKNDCNTFNGATSTFSFPFAGAVVEFWGSQPQLDSALASFWYVMDGTSGTPNLNGKYVKACIDVATIGNIGGSSTPTGTVGSHTLTAAEMPTHLHFISNTDVTSTNSPSMSSTTYMVQENSPGTQANYRLNSSATVPTVGKTSSIGSNAAHSHTLTMDSYDPPFYQLIKLVYFGY